jgi:hypothetical protein
MMPHTTIQALGQARLAELHRQAQRDGLSRAARQSRRARRQRSGYRAAAIPAARVRDARPAPENS